MRKNRVKWYVAVALLCAALMVVAATVWEIDIDVRRSEIDVYSGRTKSERRVLGLTVMRRVEETPLSRAAEQYQLVNHPPEWREKGRVTYGILYVERAYNLYGRAFTDCCSIIEAFEVLDGTAHALTKDEKKELVSRLLGFLQHRQFEEIRSEFQRMDTRLDALSGP